MAVFEGNFTQTSSFRFAIVIGRFNDLVTSKLLSGCQDCLQRHGVDVSSREPRQVDYMYGHREVLRFLYWRDSLALSHRYNAIICLGAVIRGQTPHFDYVAAEVSKGIAAVGMQTGIPVIFGILTVDSLQQALERAGIKSNKGWAFAMDALEMASLMQQMQQGVRQCFCRRQSRWHPQQPCPPPWKESGSEQILVLRIKIRPA